jgi:hypothetical protein
VIPIGAIYAVKIAFVDQDGKPQTLADKAPVHVNGAGLAGLRRLCFTCQNPSGCLPTVQSPANGYSRVETIGR